jgi:hypothetical protein
MKFKFDIEYIHDSFLKAHPGMHENHPDFIAATSRSTIEIEYGFGLDISVEEAKKNVQLSIEADDCHLLKITGGLIE